MTGTAIDAIGRCGIIPVVSLSDAGKAVPLAKALLAGGINVMEITFRTAVAAEAIAAAASQVPEMLTGAGTVLTGEQLAAAKSAGAKFIVSPGLDAEIVRLAQSAGIPIIPGVVTPSEICAALKLGLTVLKFFPAQNFGGAAAVKALAAPFGDVRFVPTGGVDASNIRDYLSIPQVLAVGGAWIAPEKLIEAGGFSAITEIAAHAAGLKESIRNA